MTDAARKLPDDETDQRTVVQAQTLEGALQCWWRDYGGPAYENIGFASRNMLVTMAEHAGEPPGSGGYRAAIINQISDEVNDAYMLMLKSKSLRDAACVLRTEYWFQRMPLDEKLKQLAYEDGIRIQRSKYYDLLSDAKAYVSGYRGACNAYFREKAKKSEKATSSG